MSDLDIDIWSDVMCPWCAIGYMQLASAIAALAGEIEVTVRWMPFELNPDAPAEGRPQAAHLAQVYRRSEAEVAAMRATVESAAERAGYPMAYTGPGDPPEAMMWNTFAAHKLLRWALAAAGPQAQTALKLALFDAHFRRRLNVSDRAVLLDLAQGQGLDRAAAEAALDDDALDVAVRMEEQRARENGINSVPTFVVNGRYILQGSQEPDRFRQALLQIASMEAAA